MGLACCLGKGHKVIALGTCGCGVGVACVGVLSFIGSFAKFSLLGFVVSLFLVATGSMLAWAMLMNSTFLATYFAFLRFPMGSGSLLSVVGAMTFGSYGTIGFLIGGLSVAVGLLSIVCHILWRKDNAAFNMVLTGR